MAKQNKVKKTVDEKISEALEVAPIVPATSKVAQVEVVEGEVIDTNIVIPQRQPLALGYATTNENPEIDEDYKSARKILDDTASQAAEALASMKEVAEQGEAAREYEVVGQLIKANLEVAKAKIDLHKDMKSLREQEAAKSGQRAAHIGDVNNSVFVGTTEELMKLNKQGKLGPAGDE
jgi:hypothetical protein